MGYESVLPQRHNMQQGNFGWVRHTNRVFQDESGQISKVIEEIQSDVSSEEQKEIKEIF